MNFKFYIMKAFIFSVLLIISIGKAGFGQVNIDYNIPPQEKIKDMIVYGSDTCHYCIDTKSYLSKNKIDFTYYDVDVNLARQREMIIKLQKASISLDNLSLPVIDLNGKLIMKGDNFEAFLKKLDPSITK